MKNLFVIGLVAIIGLFAVIAVPGANAAPVEAGKVGPYEGTFNGTVYAPNGSKAPMTLVMTHRDSLVDGTVFIGDGLNIDAGFCGSTGIPSSTVSASGKTVIGNPNRLTAASTFDVSGIDVTVNLDSQVSGDQLKANATIDLPFICGGDQVLTGTLLRAS
jgi:hypothetical protein